MPTFLFSYRAAKNSTLSPGAVAAASAWFQDIDANVADPGNPVREARSLGSCGADTRLDGFSMVAADDVEAAVALAEGYPGLSHGGGVEVGRIFELWPERASATVTNRVGPDAGVWATPLGIL